MTPYYKAGYRLGAEGNPYWPRYVPANPLKRELFVKGFHEGREDFFENTLAEWALNSDPVWELRLTPGYDEDAPLFETDIEALDVLVKSLEDDKRSHSMWTDLRPKLEEHGKIKADTRRRALQQGFSSIRDMQRTYFALLLGRRQSCHAGEKYSGLKIFRKQRVKYALR